MTISANKIIIIKITHLVFPVAFPFWHIYQQRLLLWFYLCFFAITFHTILLFWCAQINSANLLPFTFAPLVFISFLMKIHLKFHEIPIEIRFIPFRRLWFVAVCGFPSLYCAICTYFFFVYYKLLCFRVTTLKWFCVFFFLFGKYKAQLFHGLICDFESVSSYKLKLNKFKRLS